MRNYCTININGKEIGLRFGLPAIRRVFNPSNKFTLTEMIGTQETGFITVYTSLGMANLIYSGYVNNNAVRELPDELTADDIADFVDEKILLHDTAELTRVYGVFEKSTLVESLVDQQKKRTAISQETTQSPSTGID